MYRIPTFNGEHEELRQIIIRIIEDSTGHSIPEEELEATVWVDNQHLPNQQIDVRFKTDEPLAIVLNGTYRVQRYDAQSAPQWLNL